GYGDYMRVPDPKDRETHEPFHIVFGPCDPGPDSQDGADE
ncbi:MAG: LicD family protein, partial [Actinomyces sp.]|nr:LicD family protein [Actinomyces sp.]